VQYGRPARRFALTALLAAATLACGTRDEGERDTAKGDPSASGPLVVFNAGSLARPLRVALDTFAARERIRFQQEHAGSLETARKLTELGRIPDVIALADYEVFPQVLMPAHVAWYAQFARNRMVLAYTDRSRLASEVTPANWWQVVQRPGVQVGHSNPDLDPAGYRALLVFQLAESYYRQPGLAEALRRSVPLKNVRPKSADLVALAQAGELDYVWEYESVAQAADLRYLRLPDAIDLGNPADSLAYSRSAVKVVGRTPRDTITMRGAPIVYGLSIPTAAPHPKLAERFVAFLLSPAGKRLMATQHLNALERPRFVGGGVPASVTAASQGGR
jgi:molybdate/tungstate transport system substrate-binding protein